MNWRIDVDNGHDRTHSMKFDYFYRMRATNGHKWRCQLPQQTSWPVMWLFSFINSNANRIFMNVERASVRCAECTRSQYSQLNDRREYSAFFVSQRKPQWTTHTHTHSIRVNEIKLSPADGVCDTQISFVRHSIQRTEQRAKAARGSQLFANKNNNHHDRSRRPIDLVRRALFLVWLQCAIGRKFDS